MKSLFEENDYQEIMNRIDQLTPETQPKWGKMNVAQMMAHCSEVQEVMNGKELKNTPFVIKLFKGMIRKFVFNENPYPKNSKTHPQYHITNEQDFNTQKSRLITAIDKFHKEKPDATHALFGKMTEQERGWGNYKHLDHHLSQFGV